VGPPEEGALSQIKTCAKTADKVALMADHHYAVPIGGVVAYKNSISPSVVGFDIGTKAGHDLADVGSQHEPGGTAPYPSTLAEARAFVRRYGKSGAYNEFEGRRPQARVPLRER
jgi:hypothetical protein